MRKGAIYMIPVTLGNDDHTLVITDHAREVTKALRLFAVENLRSARRYLRSIDKAFPVDDSLFFDIGKHAVRDELDGFFKRVIEGSDAGVMSEAGMPGLADPGATVTSEAHRRGIKVIPLSGPSSIIMSLVASGLNGQSFAFNGYLPVDDSRRQQAIRDLEKRSVSGQTQIFMETPFRADKMFTTILRTCRPDTRLCVACDISLASEEIRTMAVAQWAKLNYSVDKRLVVFLILAGRR